jgi:hypothetical protein
MPLRDYSLVNKLLFPAPNPSYSHETLPLHWLKRAPENGEDICITVIPYQATSTSSAPHPRPVILYCHGNGEDIGHSYHDFHYNTRFWQVSTHGWL